jgi:hypothetical protein
MKKRNWTKRAATVIGFFALLAWCAASGSVQLYRSPAATERDGSKVLPFSLAQVLNYFDDAFGKAAYRGYGDTPVYHAADATLDESVTIAVSEMEQRISVTLITNSDWGVNYLREFFEAPFFFQSESEQLYALLNETTGTQSVELGRFDVDAGIFEEPGWLIVTMEFRPSAHLPEG